MTYCGYTVCSTMARHWLAGCKHPGNRTTRTSIVSKSYHSVVASRNRGGAQSIRLNRLFPPAAQSHARRTS